MATPPLGHPGCPVWGGVDLKPWGWKGVRVRVRVGVRVRCRGGRRGGFLSPEDFVF